MLSVESISNRPSRPCSLQTSQRAEAAPEFEGYLEGAVRAADRAVTEVLDLT